MSNPSTGIDYCSLRLGDGFIERLNPHHRVYLVAVLCISGCLPSMQSSAVRAEVVLVTVLGHPIGHGPCCHGGHVTPSRSSEIEATLSQAVLQTVEMDLAFMGWASPSDAADLQRKLSACEHLTRTAVALAERDLPVQGASGPPSPGAPILPLAVFEEFGRAIKTFRSCVQLASTGYGPQSLILSGVAMQSSLIVMWAVKEGASVDERADLHARYGYQIDLEQRRSLGLWKSLPAEDYLAPAERDAAAQLFGESPLGLWTGHASVMDIIDDLASKAQEGLERSRILALKLAAAETFSLMGGAGRANQSQRTVITLADGQRGLSVNIGSSPGHIPNALFVASMGLLYAADAIVTNFAPDAADDLRRSEAFLWRAWKPLEQLAGLEDSDPCPCDRPDTLWGECHKWTDELGTVDYVPFSDDDLVNFTGFDPSVLQSADQKYRGTPAADLPKGPQILTFTFRLPFTLGLEDGGSHFMALEEKWADRDDVAHFGETPMVRIRLHNQPTNGLEVWPQHAGGAIKSFYGEVDDLPTRDQFPPIPGAYEQWVTIETPSGRIASESPDDPAYAFHRGMNALNSLLTTLELSVSDRRITSVSTHDLGAVVFRGAIGQGGKWQRVGDLLMHIDSYPFPIAPQAGEDMKRQLDSNLHSLRMGRKFLTAALWFGRAKRARDLRGDNADCVVSAQTAAESMLYDLLYMLLVDEGMTSVEIDQVVSLEKPFKTLITKDLPSRLGGDWNIDGKGPVGTYWRSLYLLRNRVTHAGYTPASEETSLAVEAYLGIREFVNQRLWRLNGKYPRTLLTKIGENGLVRRNWMSKGMRTRCSEFRSEPRPFFWPKDIAGR